MSPSTIPSKWSVLRSAGAIVVGKMNTPEFGYTAITKNLLFGTTRNPWNLDRTPGGSSGGASAGISGAVVSLATAGDGGGSIRIPASFTGCFGLKTSYGRIPRGPEPLWINDDTAVYGPLTRTVEDAALFLDVTAGQHPSIPTHSPRRGSRTRKTLRDPAQEAAFRLHARSRLRHRAIRCRGGGARGDERVHRLGP
jgi:Asp-tRNA(Asn)/Glu-tRNA(Gln) amidotransferase A subunit family amidase